MRVSLAGFELQNIVRDTAGGMRTRQGLQSIKTPTNGTVFVAGFTLESPNTTEPWHYLVEQSSTTAVCTLRVFTEEYLELFSVDLGPLPLSPVITYGTQLNQIQINGPSLAGPLYGLVGGGLLGMVKTTSTNTDTTAINPPTGYVTAFGDRLPVASGSLVYFNDPGVDPRTYVAENVVPFPGTIYDIAQGLNGGLYVFTSAGVYVMAGDALGQGQEVAGFISRVPGLETTRPRNAAASNGQIAVLQRDGIQLIDGPNIPILRSKQRRYWAKVVDVEDLRINGQIFPTPRGFVVGFSNNRGYYLDIDLKTQSWSWVTSITSAYNVVGTLRSREGGSLVVLRSRVVQSYGDADWDGSAVRGVASGVLDLPDDARPVLRRLTVSADNVGNTISTVVNGDFKTTTSPTKTSDIIINTTTWGSSHTFAGRTLRTVRTSHVAETADAHIEVRVDGADRKIAPYIDVEFSGQRRARRDLNQ